MKNHLENLSDGSQLALRKLKVPLIEYYYSVMPLQKWHLTAPGRKDLDPNRGTLHENRKDRIHITKEQSQEYLSDIKEAYSMVQAIHEKSLEFMKRFKPKKTFWKFKKKDEYANAPEELIELQNKIESLEGSLKSFLSRVEKFDIKNDNHIKSLKYIFNSLYFDVTNLENYLANMEK